MATFARSDQPRGDTDCCNFYFDAELGKQVVLQSTAACPSPANDEQPPRHANRPGALCN